MTFFFRGPFCFLLFLGFRGPFWKNLFTQGVNDFRQGSFLILWLFLSEASEALFCFLLFSGFRGPLRKNLFTQGGNNFRQGSFFIIWLFCPRLLRPFCFFRASEALFRQTYLLQVVTIFDKDHFSLYDFFCPPRLLRPFCLGVWWFDKIKQCFGIGGAERKLDIWKSEILHICISAYW